MTGVTIVATTWLPPGNENARLKALETALYSWSQHIILQNNYLHLHVADDGSEPKWFEAIKESASWYMHMRHNPGRVTFSQQHRKGVGASLNAGLREAFRQSPIVLHAVDDWELLQDLDITPWVNFLEDPNYDVGMVRFFPHPDLTGLIRHVPPHGWAAVLERDHFVFGFRPCLWHKRFFDALGYFKEGVSSFEAEDEFNKRLTERYPQHLGEHIWLALPEMWRPIETGSLAAVVPG